MALLQTTGFVLLIGAASACGGLKPQLVDTPQQRIARLNAQLDDCRAENQRLRGEAVGAPVGGGGTAVSPQPTTGSRLQQQLADTPQRQIDKLNAQLAECQDETRRLQQQR